MAENTTDTVEQEKTPDLVEEPFSLSNEDFFKISLDLQDKHVLFYKFWAMGAPLFTKSIPTACVVWDRDNFCAGFYFNPDFWKNNDKYTRLFVIAHEMMHVTLNHGARIRDSKQKQIANVALDVVVNHLLVNKFGFFRDKVKIAKDACWVDTVKDKHGQLVFVDDKGKLLPDNMNFEFYYRKLMEAADSDRFETVQQVSIGKGGGKGKGNPYNLPSTIDDHRLLEDKDLSDAAKELNEALSDEEKESLRDMVEKSYEKDNDDQQHGQKAGDGTGAWVFIDPKKWQVARKKKWETIIAKWARKYLREDSRDVEQWAREHRRLAEFQDSRDMVEKDTFLPSEVDVEDMFEDEHQIDVYFFLDTSGSCWGLKDRFFKAAASLPPEKFKVRLFCFDTAVHETTLASGKVYGGGGTDFAIIEAKIQQILNKESAQYPKAVFLITDGYGSAVKPAMPKNWYWFLTETNYRYYIPKDCKVYKLNDFE